MAVLAVAETMQVAQPQRDREMLVVTASVLERQAAAEQVVVVAQVRQGVVLPVAYLVQVVLAFYLQ